MMNYNPLRRYAAFAIAACCFSSVFELHAAGAGKRQKPENRVAADACRYSDTLIDRSWMWGHETLQEVKV